jgi:hypothetical protein
VPPRAVRPCGRASVSHMRARRAAGWPCSDSRCRLDGGQVCARDRSSNPRKASRRCSAADTPTPRTSVYSFAAVKTGPCSRASNSPEFRAMGVFRDCTADAAIDREAETSEHRLLPKVRASAIRERQQHLADSRGRCRLDRHGDRRLRRRSRGSRASGRGERSSSPTRSRCLRTRAARRTPPDGAA